MALRDLMIKDVTSLPPTASVIDAAKFMADMNVGSVIVMKDNSPSGFLTDRDIVTKVLAQGKDPKTTKISEIMVAPVVTVSEDKGIFDIIRLMSTNGIRRVPVVDSNGKLVGFIALDDVLVLLGQEMQNIAMALKAELGISQEGLA
jgi:signal-transduction protein with cAMP-binding, CBS, and nucleotidyltransferase domain